MGDAGRSVFEGEQLQGVVNITRTDDGVVGMDVYMSDISDLSIFEEARGCSIIVAAVDEYGNTFKFVVFQYRTYNGPEFVFLGTVCTAANDLWLWDSFSFETGIIREDDDLINLRSLSGEYSQFHMDIDTFDSDLSPTSVEFNLFN